MFYEKRNRAEIYEIQKHFDLFIFEFNLISSQIILINLVQSKNKIKTII